MRKLLMIAAVAILPLTAQAQFSLGLRLGYAPAMGKVGGDIKMKDYTVKSQIPIQVDAMYKVSPAVSVGGYFSYGIGQVDYAGCDVADCSGSTLRLGVQGMYAFNSASQQFVPWLGAGIGWEKVNDTAEFGGQKFESSYSGWEFLNLQAGADYKVNEQLSVGPYLMFSMGQFTTAEEGGTEYDITNTAMHEWFGFGFRGKFDL